MNKILHISSLALNLMTLGARVPRVINSPKGCGLITL
jgi:hypothetical protein